MACLNAIDVAILAGGLGTRVRRTLGEVPKVLAPINSRPYLDHLLDRLESMGAERIVLCLGHRAEAVIRHVGDRRGIVTVVEPRPLGTGGGLAFAQDHLNSDPVLVMNGDTWIDVDLEPFVAFHRSQNASLTLMCLRQDDVSRFGEVVIADGRIERFVEKDPRRHTPGLISGGMYLFAQSALNALCESGAESLECDFFATRPSGTIHGFVPKTARFIDIGTPESLEEATRVFPRGTAT